MIYPLDASTVQIALTFDRVGSSLSDETPTSTGMERRHRRPALQRAERRPQRTRQGTRYAGHPPALTAARHRKDRELPHYPFRYLEKSNAVGRPVRGAPPCALHRHVRDDLNNQRKGHGEPRPPHYPFGDLLATGTGRLAPAAELRILESFSLARTRTDLSAEIVNTPPSGCACTAPTRSNADVMHLQPRGVRGVGRHVRVRTAIRSTRAARDAPGANSASNTAVAPPSWASNLRVRIAKLPAAEHLLMPDRAMVPRRRHHRVAGRHGRTATARSTYANAARRRRRLSLLH